MFFVSLLNFRHKNGLSKVLKYLKTNFPSPKHTVGMQSANGSMTALFVVSSASEIEEKEVLKFKNLFWKDARVCHRAVSRFLYVVAGIHGYNTGERFSKAIVDSEKSYAEVKDLEVSKFISVSEFRLSHSIIILELPEELSLLDAASVLKVINISKNNNVFQFNSAAVGKS